MLLCIGLEIIVSIINIPKQMLIHITQQGNIRISLVLKRNWLKVSYPYRGFFFSHIGWLLCKKHPDVKNKGKCLDTSDLEQDPILYYQKKWVWHHELLCDMITYFIIIFRYYMLVMPLLCFLIPTVVPVYYWGETWTNAWFVATMFRYTFILNVTWLVNSAAHKWGGKPYDKWVELFKILHKFW